MCLQITQKFIDNLKYLAQKTLNNRTIRPEHVGHLVPLTVGHRDPPREDKEVPYIDAVIGLSSFRYEDKAKYNIKNENSPIESVINEMINSPISI